MYVTHRHTGASETVDPLERDNAQPQTIACGSLEFLRTFLRSAKFLTDSTSLGAINFAYLFVLLHDISKAYSTPDPIATDSLKKTFY